MIWRSSYHSRIAQIADFLTSVVGFFISYLIALKLNMIYPNTFPPKLVVRDKYYFIIVIISLLFVFLFNGHRAYNYQRFTSLLKEYTIVFKVSFYGFLFTMAIAFLLDAREVPRTILIVYFVLSIILFLLEKTILFYVAKHMRKKTDNRKRVVLIGTGKHARNFIEKVKINFDWGLDIVGLLTGDSEAVGKKVDGIQIIDNYKNIQQVLKTINPEEVIVTISTKRFDQIREVLENCELAGVNVRLISDFFGHITQNVTVDNLFGLNIISFYPTHLSEWSKFVKRIIDFSISFLALVLLSPLFLVISFLIYLQDGRPVFYQWKIVGYKRKPITSWKFRTMVRNADELKKKLATLNEMTGPMFKITNDPRIIPIGNLLRKYSLDELPQLLSVLKGDLSLVGPRPPLQYEFKEFDLWHRRKLSVKPGLTCLWQVSGRSKITDFNEWAKLDLHYIDNWSLLLDFKILLKTIPVVLFGRGAK